MEEARRVRLLVPFLLAATGAPAPAQVPAGNTSLGQATSLGVPMFQLLAPDPESYEYFGTTVSMDDGTLVIGQYADFESCSGPFCRRGAAYVFEAMPSGISPQVVKLTSPGPDPDDLFGTPARISGDLVAVAARDEDGPTAFGLGAVYLFERDAGGPGAWGWTDKLTVSDPKNFVHLGTMLDLDGDTLVASGTDNDVVSGLDTVYVFERDTVGGGGWNEVAELIPSQLTPGAHFGFSLDLDEDELAVGTNSGEVYVFERDLSFGWVETARLTSPYPSESIGFGRFVAIDDDTLVVGAEFESAPEASSGAAYVFARDPGTPGGWSFEARLVASDGQAIDNFGSALAVSGQTILVSSPYHDGQGADSGTVYAFRRCSTEDGWCEVDQIQAPHGASGDLFGFDVAAQGRVFLIGAPGRDQPTFGAGAAYLRAFLPSLQKSPVVGATVPIR